MPLTLEEFPRVIFRRNPLKVVVAQVRFPSVYALEQAAGVSAFQEGLRAQYPLATPRGGELLVSVGPAGFTPPVTQLGPWRFQTDDEQWTVAVTPESVSLETSSYSRFEEFRSRFEQVLHVTDQTIRPARQERIGLRYVNEISHPEAKSVSDWQKFLDSELLGIAGGELLKEYVTQSMQQVLVVLEDGRLTIRHGYVRQDDDRSVYFLDIDAYEETPSHFEIDDVLAKLDVFKEWIWRVFRGSISDELVAYLEPQEMASA
jgi:uncharacterized protein (TIGR04255 family)